MVHIVNNTPLGTKSRSTKSTESLFAAACPRHQNCQFWANANQISGPHISFLGGILWADSVEPPLSAARASHHLCEDITTT